MNLGNLTSKKNRPMLIIGALILGVLVFIFFRGNSGGGSTQFVQAGPSEQFQIAQAQLASDSALAAAQIQGNFAIAQLQADSGIAAAEIAAHAELAAIEFTNNANLALAELTAQENLGLATIQSEFAKDAAAMELKQYQIQSNTQLQLAEFETNVRETEIAAQTATLLASLESQENMFASSINAQLEQSRNAAAMFNAQLANDALEAQYDRDISLASIGAQTEIALDQGMTDRLNITQSNKTARRGSDNNLFGNVLGGALSLGAALFSDVRLKRDIKVIGEYPDGTPKYSWAYDGAPDEHYVGPMAQDVLNTNPSAVGVSGGFLTVDYGALNG